MVLSLGIIRESSKWGQGVLIAFIRAETVREVNLVILRQVILSSQSVAYESTIGLVLSLWSRLVR